MKILLLHASAGAGHRRAAEALEKAFRKARPEAEVKVCDILDFTAKIFRKTYAEGYLDLVRKVPELWGYLYSESDRKAGVPWRKDVRALFNKINTLTFRKFYRDFDPDIVVCTHFMPLQLLTAGSRHLPDRARIYCAVTDFAVHALWILDHVDTYFVAMEEAK
ncbi:MAG: galactosyldiacylglycerol synthase, partial [bacterium]